MTASRKKTLTLMACMGLCCGILHAATIVFDAPQSIPNTSDGSFLDTSGTLVLAGNLAGSNTSSSDYTVNGITFVSKTNGIFSDNGVTATFSGTTALSVNTTPGTAWTNSALNSIFTGLATSEFGQPVSNTDSTQVMTMDFSLTGLTIGQEYQLQAMLQQASNSPLRTTVWQNGSIATPSSNQSGYVVPSSTTAGFISMSWTADDTTQDFILLFDYDWVNDGPGGGRSAINAFTVHAIPEPSTVTLALSALLAAGLLGRRRMRG